MSPTQTITSRIASYLSAHIFDKVWNEPFREYRKNIIPVKTGVAMFSGIARIGSRSVTLPVEDTTFLVYTFPQKAFGGIALSNVPEWMSIPEFLKARNIEFRVTGFDGKSLYRGDIYIRTSPINRDVLIAIKRKMFIDILGLSTPSTDIFISTYFDSDAANTITIESFVIQQGINPVNIFNKTQGASFVLINGLYTTVSSVAEVSQIGAYVEIITDANIVATVDYDLSTGSILKEFISSQDGELKKLLHIPKSINPDNKVITHNTCDFFISVKDDNGRPFGRFVNRTLSNSKIVQVTHNDFGLDLAVISEYADLLESTDLTLTLMIRTHSKNNKLIRDKNYIDLLYSHSDSVIIEFLAGTGPEDFEFWSAPHLEDSQYIKMFFNTPNSIADEHIDEYVDVLGYYQTIALISDRIHRFVVPAADTDPDDNLVFTFTGIFSVPIPVVFGDVAVYSNVLVNGRKVDDSYIIAKRFSNTLLKISFTEDFQLNPLDVVLIELFENVDEEVVILDSEVGSHSVELISLDYVVHEIVTRVTPIIGIDNQYSQTYLLVEDVSTIADEVDLAGQMTLVFKPATYGRTFVVGYRIGFRKLVYEIDDILRINEPLIFELVSPVVGSANPIPLVSDATVIPYLNGRELVEGIDFDMLSVQDPAVLDETPHMSGRQLIITNASYLKETDNTLVLLITRNAVLGKISGFLRRGQLDNTLSTALWFDELSMVTVDGYATKNVSEDYGNVAVDITKHRLGGLYGTRTLIPTTGKDFIDLYHANDDKPVLDLLVAYFAQFNLDDPEILVIPYSHRLVSPYLAIISRDIIAGDKTATLLESDEDFLDQFSEYEYLKSMDVVLLGGDQIELSFIDVQPTYVEQTTRSTIVYRVLHRLVELTLATDNVTHQRYGQEPDA